MTTMLKAAVLKKYQRFWIKRSSIRKNGSLELPVHEEYSTLRLLCESLLSEKEKAALDEIVMDDLMERTVDSNAEATCTRLVAILKDKTSGFLPNSYLGDGSTPLHVVTKARFSDCVRVLIQHDADVNAVHLQLGHSVLHVAAMVGCYQSMNHLLNAGAKRTYVNVQPGRHRSALHYAAERGSAPCLLMLLNPSQGSQVRRNEEVKEVRAVLDLPDAFGNTALHLACVDGSEECVRILIEAGASVAVRNVEGKTAVDVARAMAAGGVSSSASAVLFMVLTAAGLDPLSEPPPGATEDALGSTLAVAEPGPSLLDGNICNSSRDRAVVYSSGEPALWVIVKDGLLIASEVDAPQSNGPTAGPAPSSRKVPDVSKLSKRLRFVRRSIIGGSADEPAEGQVPVSLQTNASALARRLSVEVFLSREEAEERVRAVHHPSALACAASSSSSNRGSSVPERGSAQAVTPQRGTGTIGAGSGTGTGASAPWGSAQRRGSNSASGSTSVSLPAPSVADQPPSPVENIHASAPTISFQTAHIDERQLLEFRARVPHFFPNATHAQQLNGAAYSSVRPLVPVVVAGAVRAVAEQEDPMWAEFKRTQSASKTAGSSAHSVSSRSESGRYGDTSLSNRPVKLQRAGSTTSGSVPSPPATPLTRAPADAGNNTIPSPATSPAATSASALPSPKSLQARKVALAAECLTLGTDIAALNAQIFERMCLLEELQELKRARTATDTVESAAAETRKQAQEPATVSLLALEEPDYDRVVPAADAQVGSPAADAKSVDNEQRDKESGELNGDAGLPKSAGESPQALLPVNAGSAAEQSESVSGGDGDGAAGEDDDAGGKGEPVRALTAMETAAALERSNQLMLDGVTLSMQAELEGEGLEEEDGWEARLQDEEMAGFGDEDRGYDSEGGHDSAMQWDA